MVLKDRLENENITPQRGLVREFLELAGLGILLTVVVAVIFLAALAFGGGTERDLLDAASFYGAYAALASIIFLIFFIISLVRKLILRGKDKALLPFSSLFYDPEAGILPDLDIAGVKLFAWMKNPFHFIVIIITYFMLFGLLGAIAQFSFVSPGSYAQQALPVGRVLLGAEPAAFSETFSVMALALVLYGLAYIPYALRKINFTAFALILLVVISPLTGAFGLALHQVRYSGQEQDLAYTFFFWTGSSMLMFATGSVLAPWIWHVTNNIYATASGPELGSIYTNDILIIYTLLAIVLFNLVYWSLHYIYLKKYTVKVFT